MYKEDHQSIFEMVRRPPSVPRSLAHEAPSACPTAMTRIPSFAAAVVERLVRRWRGVRLAGSAEAVDR